MDIVDRDLEKAERDASPRAFPTIREKEDDEHLDRTVTTSTSSSSSVSVEREEIGMSRINTQRDLDRHPTSLSRIQTQRSQHEGTVGGRSLKSHTRESRKPLPNFGGGKPYPPNLPEREEYVVEFDGPDDPYHPHSEPLIPQSATYNC